MAKSWEIALSLLAVSGIARAEVVDWKELPLKTESPLPVAGAKHGALWLESTAKTSFQGILLARRPESPTSLADIEALGLDFTKALAARASSSSLNIDWLGKDETKAQGIEFLPGKGCIRSSYRVGFTTVYRTVLASEEDEGVVFVHFHADQPGALSFRVTLGSPGLGDVKIQDRRQLIFSPDQGDEKGLRAHVWVIPFESDVATEGKSITVMGEGEALIIWKFADAKTPPEDLDGTLRNLGDIHDPGHVPPNPSKIWHGVLENRMKSGKNSP